MKQQLVLIGKILITVILIFALMRGLLLANNWNYFSPLSSSELLLAFTHGVRFDLSIMVALLSIPLLLSFFTLLKKPMIWLCFIILCLALLALAMDIIFFKEAQRHVGSELLQIQNDTAFLFSILGTYWLAIIVFLVFITLLGLIWKKWIVSIQKATSSTILGKIALFPVLIFLFVLIIRGGLISGRPLSVISAFTSDSSELANLTLNGVFTGIRVSLASGDASNYNHIQFSDSEITQALGLSKAYPFEQKYFNPDKPIPSPNIIVLVIESLNYSYIDALAGNNYGVTPYLDSLINKSKAYDNFYAAGQRSVVGLQAIWTGIPSLLGFPMLHNGLSTNKISQIAKIARQKKYSTFFAQTSLRSSFNIDALANAIGFENFWGMEDVGGAILNYPNGQKPNFGYDYETLMLLKKHLIQHKKSKPSQPILAGFFSGTTHAPYARLPKQFEKYPYQIDGRNGMLNSIAYTDWSIQQFIESLTKEEGFKDTIFIITADHTSNNFSKDINYKDLFHIPLIIYSPTPDKIKVERVQEVRSQLDIMPTLMDIMNIDQSISALGTSLFKAKKYTMINNMGYLEGTISKDGYIKTDLSRLLGTDLSEDKAKRLYKRFLMTNQRVAESLLANKWAR